MAFAREIIKKILEYIRFRVPTTGEKYSYYTQINNTFLRVSNHCTRLYVWDNYLEQNPKYKGLPIVSVVFEDNENTYNEIECLTLKRYRKKPIVVNEYVYKLSNNPQFITKNEEMIIINSLKQIQNGNYNDATNKSQYFVRKSQNPTPSTESFEYKIKTVLKEVINKFLKRNR